MERVNGNELEPHTMYYIELDLLTHNTYKAKHYGTFIEYTYNHTYAYFENIKDIQRNNVAYYFSEEKGHKFVGGVYWKFFKMKKNEIERRIINSFIQQITGDENFIYLKN